MSRWDALKKSAVLASSTKTPADTMNFIADADPLTVIELIEENERLRDESHKNRMDFVDEVEMREQLRAEVEALRKDKARLDWFDGMNRALNQKYGTIYHWKVVVNHNVNRLYLNSLQIVDMNDQDCNGLPSCRDAIDAAMSNGGKDDA